MFKDDYKACNDKIKTDEQLQARVKAAMGDRSFRLNSQYRGKMFYFTRVGIPTIAGLIVIALVINFCSAALWVSRIVKAGELKNYGSYTELYEDVADSQLVEGRPQFFGSSFGREELFMSPPSLYEDFEDIVRPEGSPETPASGNYSGTNIQVEGVDEGDIVKTDGRYIYVISGNSLRIIKAEGAEMTSVSSTPLSFENQNDNCEMYVSGDRLALICSEGEYDEKGVWFPYTVTELYDVSDRSAPVLLKTLKQSGTYVTSRMNGGILYTVSERYIYTSAFEKEDYVTYVPRITRGDSLEYLPSEDIYSCVGRSFSTQRQYQVITSCAIGGDGEFLSEKAVLGQSASVYMNAENLYLCMYNGLSSEEKGEATDFSTLVKFSVSDGTLEKQGAVNIPGKALNQFSMDEYNGYFRIATTVDRYTVEKQMYWNGVMPCFYDMTAFLSQTNGVYVLDGELNIIGQVTGLAQGEEIYSVRFQRDRGYVVTFYQTDPLFEIDLSDPEHPKVTDALKIEGVSDYLHSFGEGLLLGIGRNGNQSGLTAGVKLSMFQVNSQGENEEIARYVIPNSNWSEGLYNHKALLIDTEKGLVGLPVEANTRFKYMIFQYSEEAGFIRKGTVSFPTDNWDSSEKARGLYIDDVIYVVFTDVGIKACDLETCKELQAVYF